MLGDDDDDAIDDVSEPVLDYEGAAQHILNLAGRPYAPVPVFELAHLWGFHLVWGTRSSLIGDVLTLDASKSFERQRWDCAHELGHFAAEECGHDPRDERVVDWTAGAILCPDYCFKRDLSDCEWDLREMVSRYQVSFEVAARRCVQTARCVVTIVDNGRVTHRARSHWLSSSSFDPRRLEAWEHDIAAEARLGHEDGRYHVDALVDAFVVTRDGWERVVLLVGADEWEARTRVGWLAG